MNDDRPHGRAPVEEISHLLGGAGIPLLVNGAPCGQDARFRGIYGESVLVGEPRQKRGAAVELLEFAGELQQHRSPVESVGDDVRLPERQRVRDAFRVTGQRSFRIAQKKQNSAA